MRVVDEGERERHRKRGEEHQQKDAERRAEVASREPCARGQRQTAPDGPE